MKPGHVEPLPAGNTGAGSEERRQVARPASPDGLFATTFRRPRPGRFLARHGPRDREIPT
jgi:hypothetical protein